MNAYSQQILNAPAVLFLNAWYVQFFEFERTIRSNWNVSSVQIFSLNTSTVQMINTSCVLFVNALHVQIHRNRYWTRRTCLKVYALTYRTHETFKIFEHVLSIDIWNVPNIRCVRSIEHIVVTQWKPLISVFTLLSPYFSTKYILWPLSGSVSPRLF